MLCEEDAERYQRKIEGVLQHRLEFSLHEGDMILTQFEAQEGQSRGQKKANKVFKR